MGFQFELDNKKLNHNEIINSCHVQLLHSVTENANLPTNCSILMLFFHSKCAQTYKQVAHRLSLASVAIWPSKNFKEKERKTNTIV